MLLTSLSAQSNEELEQYIRNMENKDYTIVEQHIPVEDTWAKNGVDYDKLAEAEQDNYLAENQVAQKSTELEKLKKSDNFDYTVKDSGQRQKFTTGAQRDIQDGKGRFDLLPPNAMLRLAKHFEKGAVKYGDNNWLKGIPLSRYFDSALRHAFSYMAGAKDEDHLIAAAWNLVAAVETESRIRSNILPKQLADIGPYAHPQLNVESNGHT